MSDVFKALADENRRAILELVAKQPTSAAGINKSLKLTPTVLDKHLKALVAAELLTVTTKGKTNTYSLNRKGLAEAAKWFGKFGGSFISGRADDLGDNITNMLNAAATWLETNVGSKINLDFDAEEVGRELGKRLSKAKAEATGKVAKVSVKVKKK